MKKPKSYWNHRVIKMADLKLKGLPQTYSWGIYEVFYENDKPTSWTSEPIHPIGGSWNELFESWNCMFEAFKKKTLEVKGDKLVELGLFK
jgi:hypothetical protein